MKKRHLIWIIPICVILGLIFGFINGGVYGHNVIVEKCNTQTEITNNLCDLECELQDSVLNTLEYYEKRCPNVGMDISTMSNDEMLQELKKYGIDVE